MRNSKLMFILATCIYFITACSNDDAPDPTATEELVFQSGYENCTGSPAEAHENISGADNSFSEKNDWKKDLEGHSSIENFWIYYEGGSASQRYAKIITDPGDAANKVLHFWLNEAYIPYETNKLKGRIQATIQGTNLKEILFQQKLYLHQDLDTLVRIPSTFSWLTIQEFWNNPVEQPYPFRISVNIVKPSASVDGLYFQVHGQTKRANEEAWDDVWTKTDNTFSIPIGKWMTIKTYFKEGNSTYGNFTIIVTDVSGKSYTIVNENNFTHHPDDPAPDGLNKFNPMKLYAPDRIINPMQDAGKTLQLFWDDFEFWLNKKP